MLSKTIQNCFKQFSKMCQHCFDLVFELFSKCFRTFSMFFKHFSKTNQKQIENKSKTIQTFLIVFQTNLGAYPQWGGSAPRESTPPIPRRVNRGGIVNLNLSLASFMFFGLSSAALVFLDFICFILGFPSDVRSYSNIWLSLVLLYFTWFSFRFPSISFHCL